MKLEAMTTDELLQHLSERLEDFDCGGEALAEAFTSLTGERCVCCTDNNGNDLFYLGEAAEVAEILADVNSALEEDDSLNADGQLELMRAAATHHLEARFAAAREHFDIKDSAAA